MGTMFPCHATEYEVHGVIRQTITDYDAPRSHDTYEFTVYVRDCGWLIETTMSGGKGRSQQREVGSPDGTEIYEVNGGKAFINGNSLPVELLDAGVNGHLWLMFASKCYWSGLRTDKVTPIFDWHASVGANPNLKVTAGWDLLKGPGSLPQEVRYLGEWDETNGLYTITGTNLVGGMLIPSGFIFEERYATRNGMILRKRVEAEVASVKPVCSRKDMIPARPGTKTPIIDWRIKEPASGNRLPTYHVSDVKKWPSIEEARKIAPPIVSSAGPPAGGSTSYRRAIALGLLSLSILLGPGLMIYLRIKSRKPLESK